MAKRPVFVPKLDGDLLVDTVSVDFCWHAGLSISQKQKSIRSLHESAKSSLSLNGILEISSKSEDRIGVQLSAFNLRISFDHIESTVEAAFQGSKTFSSGGPFEDIFRKSSIDAKRDSRLRSSGDLIAFRFGGRDWPVSPQTVFYDWLYLSALMNNGRIASHILEYDAFTDIEFNPSKSINCQAYAAALYSAVVRRGLLDTALLSPERFIEIHRSQGAAPTPVQTTLL